MSRKRILSVSHDATKLVTRGAMLKGCGYDVVSVLGNGPPQCKQGGFDLLLIEHSILDSEVEEMITTWRDRTDAPIVLVLRSFDRVRVAGEHYVNWLDPDQLMKTVAAALHL